MNQGSAVDRGVAGRPLRQAAWRRLAANRGAAFAAVVLAVLILAAVFGPLLAPFPYDQVNKDDVWVPPLTDGHVLGTDSLGRDLAARLMIGLRVSLAVGLLSSVVSVVVGSAWGVTAGYIGGGLDEGMMRLVDVLYALPFIFFVILLTVVFGRNLILLFVAIGAVEWLTMARVVRGQTLVLKEAAFVEAARATGLSRQAIIRRHILPNLMGPVAAYAALTIPAAIMAESFLSFLGLGVQEPLTSLGTLISTGAAEMEIAPWLLVVPSVVMIAALLCFNLIGDGLRDALDPREP